MVIVSEINSRLSSRMIAYGDWFDLCRNMVKESAGGHHPEGTHYRAE